MQLQGENLGGEMAFASAEAQTSTGQQQGAVIPCPAWHKATLSCSSSQGLNLNLQLPQRLPPSSYENFHFLLRESSRTQYKYSQSALKGKKDPLQRPCSSYWHQPK